MIKLNKELNDNKKLSESKYAKEVLRLIETLTTQPVERIKSFMGEIKGFDQEQLKVVIESDKKSLKEFGEYVYFIASQLKQDNMYGMGMVEMSENIINYFTDNLDKGWIKKIADAKVQAEKDKKAKEARELAAVELKAKQEADKLFLESFNLEIATEVELVKYAGIKSIDITKNIESKEEMELFGETKVDIIRAVIKEAETKPVKVTRADKKVAKKALKKENKGQQITFDSLFD